MKTRLTIMMVISFTLSLLGQSVTVTNTNDSGPGSLRWAIDSANNTSSIDTLKFNIPTSDAGYNASTGVFTITVSSSGLPGIKNKDLLVDGASQTAFTGNTNTTVFGTGGTVGVDNLALPTVDGPEIAIVDGASINYGLSIEEANVTVKNLAVSGFGNSWPSFNNANVLFRGSAKNSTLQSCVIGSQAHQDAAPVGDANKGSNVQGYTVDTCYIYDNYIAYGDAMGGFLKNDANGWDINGNEFAHNGLVDDRTDGLDIADNTSGTVVEGNLFRDNGGAGFDTYRSNGGHWVINNTSYGNGELRREPSGMRIYGDRSTLIVKNKIYDNPGAGILVVSGAKKHDISKNSIYNNGKDPAPGASAALRQVGIDLLAPTEDHEKGTAPFVTLNDDLDADNGGNNLLNFPIILDAIVNGSNLTVKGFAPAGARVEFFKADSYPNARWPQGKTYLFSATEGSPADADGTVGSYGPGNVNGINVGTNTSANRFEFTVPVPAGFSSGDPLTATAFKSSEGTSEFGPEVTSIPGNNMAVQPNLDCIYIDKNGDIVARFGYNNPNSGAKNISIGANNSFSPGASDQGQPTAFSSGVNSNVFSVTFPASSSRTWTLDGSSVTADINSTRCPVDLEVTQSASNNTPNVGDVVTLTVTVKNLTAGIPATGVDIGYSIDPNFTFQSAVTSKGSYNNTTQVWSINEITNGSPVTLTVDVKVNGDGTNTASVNTQNAPDPVTANNSASTTLTTGGSSGGNNGGIESEGSMSELIAQRNFERVKSGKHRFYDHLSEQPTVQEFRNARRGKVNNINQYIPAFGPQNTTATITTPNDLIGITNAVSVFAADYMKPNQTRLGAILALETQNDVYNHTKIICDRLKGAEMTQLKDITVDNKHFVLSRLDQADGSIDYSVSFVAYKEANGGFTIDNRYNQGEYNPNGQAAIYNFQVWSVSESVTKDLVTRVINKLKAADSVSYLNNSTPVMPTVYVKSGEYKNGKVTMEVVNTVGATQLDIDYNYTKSETSTRKYKTTFLQLDSSKTQETVTWTPNHLFDLGFKLNNNKAGGTDVLYFADGAWGVDYERNTGVQNGNFVVNQETGYTASSNRYHLERGASFEGDLKNYFTIYKNLRPGNLPADLSQFNQVKFDAELTGQSEFVVTIVSDSIEQWQNQFRKTVTVSNGAMTTYTVDFADMTSLGGGTIKRDDIVSISFSVTGDQNNYKNTKMEVENVVFTPNGKGIGFEEESLNKPSQFTVYPNPFSDATRIDLNQQFGGEVELSLYNLTGAQVDYKDFGQMRPGLHTLEYQPSEGIPSGVYMLELKSGENSTTQRVIIRR